MPTIQNLIRCMTVSIGVFTASSCTVVPALDGLANIPTSAIVARVKCDLVYAIQDLEERDRKRFGFLTQWGAKVHLTIAVDDSFGINPGATFIDPLSTPGTTFTLGGGIGATTEAIRTQDIEFFLYFPEMLKEFPKKGDALIDPRYAACAGDGFLLTSDLGMESGIAQALEPVRIDLLTQGNHPAIGSSVPSVPTATEAAGIKSALDQLAQIETRPRAEITPLYQIDVAFTQKHPNINFDAILKAQADKHKVLPLDSDEEKKRKADEKAIELATIASNITDANGLEERTHLLVENVINPLAKLSENSNDAKCKANIMKSQISATAWAAGVTLAKIAVDEAQDSSASQNALAKALANTKNVESAAKTIANDLRQCKTAQKKSEPPLYDPLDIISETINFYITRSATVTPAWKLVRFTAPVNTPLAAASRKDTNTMIIAMGRPVTTDGVAVGPSNAMTQQVLYSVLNQAIPQATAPAFH